MSDPLLAEIVQLLPKMRAYALVLTKSASEADDVVQDALVRAWRFRAGYVERTQLKAWLFRILRNEFLRRVHAQRLTVEDPDGKFAAQLITSPDQEFHLQHRELLAAMDLLSADTREALLLTVGEGFTYEEAADLCDCPVGTIKSRVNRGRQFLIDRLHA